MNIWIEKQRYLIDFTLASLARRKVKNFGLLLVFSVLIFLLVSVSLFTTALRHEAQVVLSRSPEVIVQRMMAGRHELVPSDYLTRLKRLRGVQQIEGRLWGYFYDPVVKANYTLQAVRDPSMLLPNQIIIGPALARFRGLEAGNVLSFRSYSGKLFTFTVAQVLPQSSELVSADLILLRPEDFRAFFDYPDQHYTDIALSVANPQETRNIANKLANLLPDARPILRDEVLRSYQSIFDWREGIVLSLLMVAVLSFTILAWDKASGLSAEEKREIGILKAIGWESGEVLQMKLWESGLLALAAFVLGYCAAYVHIFYSSAALFSAVLKGWAVLYPEFQLVPIIDGVQLTTLFLLTVVPYTLAVLVPIWRAATADPDMVMRA